MEYKKALAEIRRLGNIISQHADTSESASGTYEATMLLYNIASKAGDEEAMQKHRDTLHSCVDLILDNGAMIHKLMKEQKDISRQVTDWPLGPQGPQF